MSTICILGIFYYLFSGLFTVGIIIDDLAFGLHTKIAAFIIGFVIFPLALGDLSEKIVMYINKKLNNENKEM